MAQKTQGGDGCVQKNFPSIVKPEDETQIVPSLVQGQGVAIDIRVQKALLQVIVQMGPGRIAADLLQPLLELRKFLSTEPASMMKPVAFGVLLPVVPGDEGQVLGQAAGWHYRLQLAIDSGNQIKEDAVSEHMGSRVVVPGIARPDLNVYVDGCAHNNYLTLSNFSG
mgnify:FL=1